MELNDERNKAFYYERYFDASSKYECALSAFRWLENIDLFLEVEGIRSIFIFLLALVDVCTGCA